MSEKVQANRKSSFLIINTCPFNFAKCQIIQEPLLFGMTNISPGFQLSLMWYRAVVCIHDIFSLGDPTVFSKRPNIAAEQDAVNGARSGD